MRCRQVCGNFPSSAPDVPHQPVDLSDTEAALAIVARTTASEQEHVVLATPATSPETRSDVLVERELRSVYRASVVPLPSARARRSTTSAAATSSTAWPMDL
jgi:hypothetical protein